MSKLTFWVIGRHKIEPLLSFTSNDTSHVISRSIDVKAKGQYNCGGNGWDKEISLVTVTPKMQKNEFFQPYSPRVSDNPKFSIALKIDNMADTTGIWISHKTFI